MSKGSIVEIFSNENGLYENSLAPYLKILFEKAQNIRHPYHNLRHMLHVVYLCHRACVYYASILNGNYMSKRDVRDLLIAATFHDFDHSGQLGHDDLNIERALRGLRKYIQSEDMAQLETIEQLIRISEFPYIVPSDKPTLLGQILRDADVSQALSVAWIQQVVIGLASEWNVTPLEILRKQEPFLRNLQFHTHWAQNEFGPRAIQDKLEESKALLMMLESGVS